MNQDKRVLLAFALSFAVLLLWRVLFFKEPPPPAKAARPAPSRSTQGQPPAPAAPAPVKLPIAQGSKAEEIVIDGGDLYQVTLSTEGAVVKSWVLKNFLDEKGKPLELISRAACETLGFPMSLELPDAELTKRLNTAIYVAAPSASRPSAPVKLSLTYSDGHVQVRKQFSFGTGYEARVEVGLVAAQRASRLKVTWPGGFRDQSVPVSIAAFTEQAFYQPQGTTRFEKTNLTLPWYRRFFSWLSGSPLEEPRLEMPGPLSSVGLEDRYFAAAFLPDSPDVEFDLRRQVWTPSDWKEKEPPRLLEAALATPAGKPLAFRLFVGPKDLDVLRSVKPPLDGLVDFGWFSIVAKPLFIAMRYIYDHWIHNYGWAIVILTVLINLAMFPLKLKGIRSAQEMQRIAPLVKDIQEKYKHYKFNDPRKQRMNQEVMKLYQEHGINPFGGCLPMVLQLPFLYAFYNVLSLSIELRHAPWILWLKDLSSPDNFRLFGFPLPILPILMTVTMYFLQKMTPITTADPGQQRMMMIMPLFFGIMSFNFASGLVLYWLTANVVGIAQQALINRMFPAAQPAPVPRKAVGVKE